MDYALSVQSLSVSYFYGASAVKELDLDCTEGEKIAFISADEGGKTTVLKCVAGLTPATSGKILVKGEDITANKTKQRDVCMLFDDGGIMKWSTVRFHLEYPLRLRKVSKTERTEKIKAVAKQFGLTPILTDLGRMVYPDDIVRIGFARAVLRNASVTLIDDVFALLKAQQRKTVFREMLPVIKGLKGVVLFATSDIDEAFSVGDRIVVMNFGFIHQIGTPEELKNKPSTLFVDTLVTPLRAVSECDVIGVEGAPETLVFGKTVKLNAGDEYLGKKLFASASLKEGGEEKANVVSFYFFEGTRYAVTDNGLYVKVNEDFSADTVSYSPEEIRFFDYASETAVFA